MTKRGLILLLLSIVLLPSGLMAQKERGMSRKAVKKEISTARDNIKKGSNLESAEQSMRRLLADTANIGNERIWLTLFEAVKKQYEQLNEKLYLKQESDTAKFFTHTLHMFDVLESLDSIDAKPDADGVVDPKYRKDHAAFLDQRRSNLYGGGGYYVKRQDFQEAYKFFEAYVDCARQPLFTGYPYDCRSLAEAAYWAVFCGYKLDRPDIVDRYSPIALCDSTRESYVLQYMAEAYLQHGDTASYGQTLRKGFSKYPENAYFFSHLAVFHNRRRQYDEMLAIAEEVLSLNPGNVSAKVVKGTALFHLESYAECVKISDEVIKTDSTMVVPYANAGLAYYNQTVPLTKKKTPTKAERRQLQELYKRALPYLEKYRRLDPDAKDVWAAPLYNIYLNLNMGDEFEKMEKIINS